MGTMNPAEIKTHPTFSGLFPIKPELLAAIEEDIRQRKYDFSQHVILATWHGQEEPVCIDGHTRIQAAINAGIEGIPVWLKGFDDEADALECAIRLQKNRRNMTDAEILACTEALDKRKARGGDRRSDEAKSIPQSCGIENSRSASARETGDLLGISPRKVEQTRTVLDHADPETVQAVKHGEMSINRAYQETQNKRTNAKSHGKSTTPQSKTSADKSAYSLEDFSDAEEETPPAEQTAHKPTADTSVILDWEQHRALRDLGGSIEDHVELAIDMYLRMLADQFEEFAS